MKPPVICSALYMLLGAYIWWGIHGADAYESCGFEAVLTLQTVYPYFFFGAVVLSIVGTCGKSTLLPLLTCLLMSLPAGLACHGICGHASYAWLILPCLLLSLYHLPLALKRLYTAPTVGKVLALILCVLLYAYAVIMTPAIISFLPALP